MTNDTINRRPLATRSKAWAHKLAHLFAARGMTPNQMSVLSIVFAATGAASYAVSIYALPGLFLFIAAGCIQLRLLANMLDGLMAVEEGKKEPTGVLYNELPDRIADTLFLVGAGYAGGCPTLGWCAAVLAVLTAYIRALGGSLGFAQDFTGPMAKPHRMFALTVGSVIAIFFHGQPVLPLTLAAIVLGAVWTCVRRTIRLAEKLKGSSHD